MKSSNFKVKILTLNHWINSNIFSTHESFISSVQDVKHLQTMKSLRIDKLFPIGSIKNDWIDDLISSESLVLWQRTEIDKINA